jgi:hypothetical protein
MYHSLLMDSFSTQKTMTANQRSSCLKHETFVGEQLGEMVICPCAVHLFVERHVTKLQATQEVS